MLFKLFKVGEYLKRPRHPIWVVCSESHFSVLFSLNKSLTSDLLEETTFDLYFYDCLANQQEQIRLTVCKSIWLAYPFQSSFSFSLCFTGNFIAFARYIVP